MQKFITIFYVLLLGFFVSCTQKKAPVIDRSNNIYHRSSDNGYHQVASGETLFGISRQYGTSINDLLDLNDLEGAQSLKAGQKLKIGKANSVKNKSGSVAYQKAIASRKQDVKTKELKPVSSKSLPKVSNKNNRFSWPIKGTVISKFGPKAGGLYNDGINIKANAGSTVKATEDGVVAYVGDELRGYGNLIIVKHSGGWISAYAHLDKTKVSRGSKVNKGQTIATVGSTGNVKDPQLYFGLRKGREAVDPQSYL